MATVSFPGRFKSLAGIRKFVNQAARYAGFKESEIYAVELAVDEACSNIIEHAYGGEGKGEIKCTCNNLDSGLEIIIRDNGTPFDPSSVPTPNFTLDLDDLKPRGAGLYLIHNLMDEVDYKFHKNKGNVLRMVKRKSP